MGHADLAMTKRYVAYTLGDIKRQHVHAFAYQQACVGEEEGKKG